MSWDVKHLHSHATLLDKVADLKHDLANFSIFFKEKSETEGWGKTPDSIQHEIRRQSGRLVHTHGWTSTTFRFRRYSLMCTFKECGSI